jgi:hypothetical protein
MSWTISPVEWLESALFLLVVYGIFEHMRSDVVNDENDELWMYNITFAIPIRYNPELHQYIVQRDVSV